MDVQVTNESPIHERCGDPHESSEKKAAHVTTIVDVVRENTWLKSEYSSGRPLDNIIAILPRTCLKETGGASVSRDLKASDPIEYLKQGIRGRASELEMLNTVAEQNGHLVVAQWGSFMACSAEAGAPGVDGPFEVSEDGSPGPGLTVFSRSELPLDELSVRDSLFAPMSRE